MKLSIYRIYELHEYSFLAVFKVQLSNPNETLDTKIFVCGNDLLCRSQPGCTPGQRVGRYVLCGTLPDPPTVMDPLPEYDVPPDFTIYPNRVLESIASITDMDIYDDDPDSNEYGFYRAETVAMMFNTESLMNSTIEHVINDFKKHVRAMESKTADTELITYNHFTDDDLRDYFFQG